MMPARKGRSGRIFFLIFLVTIVTAILATLLMANDRRNLTLLLTRLGYAHVLDATAAGSEATVRKMVIPAMPGIHKGRRLQPGRMELPVYAFADMKATEQHFLRRIQSDPRSLCEQLKNGGFDGMEWTVSSASAQSWECASTVTLPADGGVDAPQSSVFVFIKGDVESRVSSFRVKMNIENPQDRTRVTELGAKAASIFLTQARWENGDGIVDQVRLLKEFDLRNFGSRIQMKKEFGETPRYNFLASQSPLARSEKPEELYFDRSRWFPLTDSNGVPMMDGMMAGEAAGGWALPGLSAD